MNNRFIPLSVPHLKGNETKYVLEVVESEWVSSVGLFVNRFEEEIAKYVGVGEAVACQSGTAALHLAMLSLGLGAGDEIIVPTLTFIAAVNPVRYIGAVPVFMDCDDSLCMDPVKLEKFCMEECIFKNGSLINKSTSAKVKAIVVVHIFGNMADMESIMDIAKKYGLIVIEDATESLGTYYKSGIYKGKCSGTIGDIGAYSFNGNKIITTGGGGMLVSENKELLKKAKYLSTQAKDDGISFTHSEIGYNYRMTNVQAALGVAQLEQLELFIENKKQSYEHYINLGVELLPFRDKIRPNYWFYSYMARNADDRDEIIQELGESNIQARPVWGLIHEQKPYREFQVYNIEKSIYYADRIVNLPCSSNLSMEDVERVAGMVK